jgi:hypothetical protein
MSQLQTGSLIQQSQHYSEFFQKVKPAKLGSVEYSSKFFRTEFQIPLESSIACSKGAGLEKTWWRPGPILRKRLPYCEQFFEWDRAV